MKKILKRALRKIVRTLFVEQWSILVCGKDNAVLRHVVPPKGIIWADPFPIINDGHYFIFVEQQRNGENGTLGYIELFDDLTTSSFMPILKKDYHLSYPNVFSHNSKWYMIPETHEHGSIDLYRAVSFPDLWAYDSTLIENIVAVDTSIAFHNGLWWLFTSSRRNDSGLSNSLSLFYSKEFPSTAWTSHPANPVVTGSENSRMAGAIFINPETNTLVRPAQSCKKEYGEHLGFNQILELSEEAYKEKRIGMIMPEKGLKAVCTHTWNCCDRYIIRDIKTRIFRFRLHLGKREKKENA